MAKKKTKQTRKPRTTYTREFKVQATIRYRMLRQRRTIEAAALALSKLTGVHTSTLLSWDALLRKVEKQKNLRLTKTTADKLAILTFPKAGGKEEIPLSKEEKASVQALLKLKKT